MMTLDEVVDRIAKDMVNTWMNGGNPHIDLRYVAMMFDYDVEELTPIVNRKFQYLIEKAHE